MPLDSLLLQKLIETFEVELHEIHQAMIASLLVIEKSHSIDTIEDNLKALFRYSHNMKGAAKSVGMDAIAAIAHCLEDLFSNWREKRLIPNKEEIHACLEVIDNTLLALNNYKQGRSIDIENYLQPLHGEKTQLSPIDELTSTEVIKLPLIRIEQANDKVNEFVTYRLKLASWLKLIAVHLNELHQLETSCQQQEVSKKLANILEEGGDLFSDFSHSLQSLQSEMRAMQMLPVSYVLLPLARTVHDLARTLNKSVELQVEGGDIELDKSIIDAIKDPLLHLVRNALDHGIETDEQRQKLNKPIPATIHIQVFHQSGKTKLKFADDGQGINIEKIKKRIVSHGLRTEEEISNLDDQQLVDFIFESGFTTQTTVTELSGRGVGLDAVKNSIQKIKGRIVVETKLGQGSCFTLELPLTLAITRGLFVRVGEQIVMFPTLSLHSLHEIAAHAIKFVDNECVVIINNKPIVLKLLSNILNINSSFINQGKSYCGLLIEDEHQQLVFLVDEIIDEHECVVNALPLPLSKLEQYIGTTLNGRGELALVIDPAVMMQWALVDKTSLMEVEQLMSRVTTEIKKKRILIVDDSLTTRTLCASALETAGYITFSTTDGKKAWQLLQNESFDCVVTDIVMPEIDGFELTKLIKNSNKHRLLPIIIVSSLHSAEEQKQGLELGASAYLIKSEFDTRSLIDTIGLLI